MLVYCANKDTDIRFCMWFRAREANKLITCTVSMWTNPWAVRECTLDSRQLWRLLLKAGVANNFCQRLDSVTWEQSLKEDINQHIYITNWSTMNIIEFCCSVKLKILKKNLKQAETICPAGNKKHCEWLGREKAHSIRNLKSSSASKWQNNEDFAMLRWKLVDSDII